MSFEEKVEEQLAGISQKLAGIEGGMAGIEGEMAGINHRMAGVEGRLAHLQTIGTWFFAGLLGSYAAILAVALRVGAQQ